MKSITNRKENLQLWSGMADNDEDNEKLSQKAQGCIYMEDQLDAMCALHAVNGVFQGPRFCQQDFLEKACEMEKGKDAVHH